MTLLGACRDESGFPACPGCLLPVSVPQCPPDWRGLAEDGCEP